VVGEVRPIEVQLYDHTQCGSSRGARPSGLGRWGQGPHPPAPSRQQVRHPVQLRHSVWEHREREQL